jgi:hypothetical protein
MEDDMTYEDAATKAAQAAETARQVAQSTDDAAHRGLAEALALVAEALGEMSMQHHRQF